MSGAVKMDMSLDDIVKQQRRSAKPSTPAKKKSPKPKKAKQAQSQQSPAAAVNGGTPGRKKNRAGKAKAQAQQAGGVAGGVGKRKKKSAKAVTNGTRGADSAAKRKDSTALRRAKARQSRLTAARASKAPNSFSPGKNAAAQKKPAQVPSGPPVLKEKLLISFTVGAVPSRATSKPRTPLRMPTGAQLIPSPPVTRAGSRDRARGRGGSAAAPTRKRGGNAAGAKLQGARSANPTKQGAGRDNRKNAVQKRRATARAEKISRNRNGGNPGKTSSPPPAKPAPVRRVVRVV